MNEQEIFDRIKKEADSSPVPDSLHPEKMEETLSGVRQKRRAARFPLRQSQASTHRRIPRTALATAACLALVLITGLALRQSVVAPEILLPETTDAQRSVQTGEAPDGHGGEKTYDTVCRLINRYQNEVHYETSMAENDTSLVPHAPHEEIGGTDDSFAATSKADSRDYSDTDTQVEDVMEGDIVKTDGSHIYTIWKNTVGYTLSIYQVDGGATEFLSATRIYNQNCNEMYLDGNRVVLLGTPWDESGADENDASADVIGVDDSPLTSICVYDVSRPEKPKKTASLSQSGRFNTSRLCDGVLYTFSNYQVFASNCSPEKPEKFVPQINGRNIPPEDIFLTDKKSDNSYMVMTSLVLDEPEDFKDSLAAFGNFDTCYVNTRHIYTVKSSYDSDNSDLSAIARYTCEGGIFRYDAKAQIRGQIKNSYCLHEYKGNLCLVYTRSDGRRRTNGLAVMDGNMKLSGEISDLGIDEEVYASYFIDNIAYFVTYRQTDPVFAVDFSNPEKPELKSELKLPGFSDYLHSFGDGMLVGIGKGGKKADGNENSRIKLSLFSIGKNYELTETATALLGKWSECSAGEDHRTVFVDEARRLIGFCTVSEDGAVKYFVFRYQNGRWEKALSHTLKDSKAWAEDVRGLRIGEYFYVVDVSGVTIHAYDIRTWKSVEA